MTGHRPLLWLAAAMGLLVVVAGIGVFADPREVLGAPLWAKPLKFAISIAIYAVTLSWLIGQLHRMRRLAHIAGTVSVAGLVVEMIIIVGAAVTGDTSHFNVSTPIHAAMWSVMAVSIVVVWVMTLVVAVALFRNKLGDPARTLAIRAGVIIALVGMGLAFLMTSPTAQQLDDFQGVAGAHAVGVADGRAGLFLLGWSTEAGDLRIPHFVGMHALQVLPIFLITLELLSRRMPRLSSPQVRLRLVRVAVVAYAATVTVVTWQALAGQSIVAPAGPILVAGVTVTAATVLLAAAALVAPVRQELQRQG
ncbi:hypothetical protein QMG83_11210 [Salinibacterium sp. G-O1]|uniref:hypothetical protein n=1 Tax=Salinibacterium sp. G-O1 TaxID=3046208 RepID=UPI0024B9D9DF|nr:hypothetical protein [Salinibacterium sp. G-O1]MDJ0335793.1 hypothetical protein [Salinibacterium sp. G-O1]